MPFGPDASISTTGLWIRPEPFFLYREEQGILKRGWYPKKVNLVLQPQTPNLIL